MEKLNANPTVYASGVLRKISDPGTIYKCRIGVALDTLSAVWPVQQQQAAATFLTVVQGSAVGPLGASLSRDVIDAEEVFEMIRHINDPEHPLTLEQLKVVSRDAVLVDDDRSCVAVQFTPTIPHCSMATLIGLCICVKLRRSLPSRFKFTVRIAPGSHSSEAAVNKQLGDKERVAAALENSQLMAVVNKCISLAAAD